MLATKTISFNELKQLDCQIPQPVYPRKSKRLDQEGVVVLKVTIGANGHVVAAAVSKSSGFPLLDAAAVDALRVGQCHPYVDGGLPRQVQALQAIAFRLND
ncbi:hypothetical protein ABW99_02670 [Pandoraea thiooxydans]|uniref:TonB C-terminal domain-containing protein n=2 Tax=Pandoraea thiooxydans TaxID=445709 RepID=A0A0G3EK22_9BURK|nr:hypothetical protein ABW99_02670 [Pandoraea thiooxydans]